MCMQVCMRVTLLGGPGAAACYWGACEQQQHWRTHAWTPSQGKGGAGTTGQAWLGCTGRQKAWHGTAWLSMARVYNGRPRQWHGSAWLTPGVGSMPVFRAAAPMSLSTESSCAASTSGGTACTACTPRVFWAVTAVTALMPKAPHAMKACSRRRGGRSAAAQHLPGTSAAALQLPNAAAQQLVSAPAPTFRSAWMPAPPPLSDPATVSTGGTVEEGGRGPNRNAATSCQLAASYSTGAVALPACIHP